MSQFDRVRSELVAAKRILAVTLDSFPATQRFLKILNKKSTADLTLGETEVLKTYLRSEYEMAKLETP